LQAIKQYIVTAVYVNVILRDFYFEFFWGLFFCDAGKLDLDNCAWFTFVAICL